MLVFFKNPSTDCFFSCKFKQEKPCRYATGFNYQTVFKRGTEPGLQIQSNGFDSSKAGRGGGSEERHTGRWRSVARLARLPPRPLSSGRRINHQRMLSSTYAFPEQHSDSTSLLIGRVNPQHQSLGLVLLLMPHHPRPF